MLKKALGIFGALDKEPRYKNKWCEKNIVITTLVLLDLGLSDENVVNLLVTMFEMLERGLNVVPACYTLLVIGNAATLAKQDCDEILSILEKEDPEGDGTFRLIKNSFNKRETPDKCAELLLQRHGFCDIDDLFKKKGTFNDEHK
jgi:hypothetical protein